MKKPLLLVLTALLLLSSLASCSSCSRRDQYEDQLESQKEAESGALIPQPGADGVANIIGTNAGDYALAVIKKTSDKGDFAGNTEAQLIEKYRENAYQFAGNRYLPTERVIGSENGQNYFYNKLTGNISERRFSPPPIRISPSSPQLKAWTESVSGCKLRPTINGRITTIRISLGPPPTSRKRA